MPFKGAFTYTNPAQLKKHNGKALPGFLTIVPKAYRIGRNMSLSHHTPSQKTSSRDLRTIA